MVPYCSNPISLKTNLSTNSAQQNVCLDLENIGLTIPGNCWSFVADFIQSWQISCEIMRHNRPTALHETEEFFLNYLIYKFFT